MNYDITIHIIFPQKHFLHKTMEKIPQMNYGIIYAVLCSIYYCWKWGLSI